MAQSSRPSPSDGPRDLQGVLAAAGGGPFRRVRKAYEQIADQLRELILTGELEPGARLPTEQALAADFGVSRATVREALSMLASENLVRTAKGADGGSYVSRPTVDHISEFLRANVGLLSRTSAVSLEEFLEARDLLEIPAARLAAARATEADVERLAASIPEAAGRLQDAEQFPFNRDFHSALVQVSGNALLSIATQPIFSVLQTNLARSPLEQSVHRRIAHDHERILDAVRSGDPAAAAEEMREHLAYLRPQYERSWRYAMTRADQ
jgi:DNA-binding FadR family transcriptional regulator